MARSQISDGQNLGDSSIAGEWYTAIPYSFIRACVVHVHSCVYVRAWVLKAAWKWSGQDLLRPRPEPIMLLKLPIMLLSNASKISLLCSNYAPIMLWAVSLCPKHASTILQLNAQLENLITLMNVLLECFTWIMTALLEYIDLFSHS